MADGSATLLDTPETPADPARIAAQLERLDQIADFGVALAGALAERAKAPEPGEDVAALAMAFSRAARAVRMCIMLQSRLVKDGDDARRAAALADEEADAIRKRNHKARVERIVERSARAAHGPDEDSIERILCETAERLDDEDMYADILVRPVGELVAAICGELGLEPDWPLGAEEAWSGCAARTWRVERVAKSPAPVLPDATVPPGPDSS